MSTETETEYAVQWGTTLGIWGVPHQSRTLRNAEEARAQAGYVAGIIELPARAVRRTVTTTTTEWEALT